jgi:hypothetical protein
MNCANLNPRRWQVLAAGVLGTVGVPGAPFQVPWLEVLPRGFTLLKWGLDATKNPVDATALFVKFPARLTDLE